LPIEVICIDDGSDDNSFETANCFDTFGRFNLEVIKLNENQGVAAARNIGLSRARCEYVAFLDSDDVWHARKLEFQMGCIEEFGLGMIGGFSGRLSNDEPIPEFSLGIEVRNKSVHRVNLLFAVARNPYNTSSVLVKRNEFLRFPEGQLSEDFSLWLTLIASGIACARHDVYLSYMYKHPYATSGLSSKLFKMEVGELKSIRTLASSHPFIMGAGTIISVMKFFIRYTNRTFSKFFGACRIAIFGESTVRNIH
jgi:glycosyltransferase involved in cell wall biosynthesis